MFPIDKMSLQYINNDDDAPAPQAQPAHLATPPGNLAPRASAQTNQAGPVRTFQFMPVNLEVSEAGPSRSIPPAPSADAWSVERIKAEMETHATFRNAPFKSDKFRAMLNVKDDKKFTHEQWPFDVMTSVVGILPFQAQPIFDEQYPNGTVLAIREQVNPNNYGSDKDHYKAVLEYNESEGMGWSRPDMRTAARISWGAHLVENAVSPTPEVLAIREHMENVNGYSTADDRTKYGMLLHERAKDGWGWTDRQMRFACEIADSDATAVRRNRQRWHANVLKDMDKHGPAGWKEGTKEEILEALQQRSEARALNNRDRFPADVMKAVANDPVNPPDTTSRSIRTL